jgi:hypothetical protein
MSDRSAPLFGVARRADAVGARIGAAGSALGRDASDRTALA